MVGISIYTYSLIWVSIWSEDTDPDNRHYLSIYIYLGIASAFFAFIRNFSLCYQNIVASKYTHTNMLKYE